MMFKTTDVFSQLQPRHVSRRERQPGARERHSAQRQRLPSDQDDSSQHSQSPRVQHTSSRGNKSSYSMNSAVADFSQRTHHKPVEPEVVVSRFKELSTIDEIRASMKVTARATSAPPTHVPDWMLNLDINLDVTSLDIIPPFSEPERHEERNETYTESPSFVYVDDDTELDFEDEIENLEEEIFSQIHNQRHVKDKNKMIAEERNSPRTIDTSERLNDKKQIMSNTFKVVAERFTPRAHTPQTGSPRRYQGDKRVMSLQQGGIRSTPMQPKSKKYINQMITYHHMKHHDRKLNKAKPAVDTKMPSTFKYALERKQLVEQRLSQSWSRAEQTPSPSKSPTSMSNSKSHSTPRDSR